MNTLIGEREGQRGRERQREAERGRDTETQRHKDTETQRQRPKKRKGNAAKDGEAQLPPKCAVASAHNIPKQTNTQAVSREPLCQPCALASWGGMSS